jgi:hypothetical protein
LGEGRYVANVVEGKANFYGQYARAMIKTDVEDLY